MQELDLRSVVNSGVMNKTIHWGCHELWKPLVSCRRRYRNQCQDAPSKYQMKEIQENTVAQDGAKHPGPPIRYESCIIVS